jgi:class 3 adenylate cyclase
VVGGIVGTTKFAFDIWGETVNIAARMEDKGATNRVNISGSTYALVKDYFTCEYRGNIPIKNIGEAEMYFVTPAERDGREKKKSKKSNPRV